MLQSIAFVSQIVDISEAEAAVTIIPSAFEVVEGALKIATIIILITIETLCKVLRAYDDDSTRPPRGMDL